jgi:arylsulfatase A-like enzyme
MNNFPLRGCKGGYYEGGVRGVGLIHGVGLGRTGVVSDGMHHVNDWMPTLLSAAAAAAAGDPTARHTRCGSGCTSRRSSWETASTTVRER